MTGPVREDRPGAHPLSLLPPNQLGTHLADSATVASIRVQTGGAGLIIGTLPDGAPMTVALFAPEPTTAVVVGTVRFAQLIAFRALALGARSLVQTSRPAAWTTFIHSAAGSSGAIELVEEVDLSARGTSNHPLLVIIDNEAEATSESRRGGTWSTVLTVREHLSQWNAGSLAQADIALVQPLSLAEARLAGSALNRRDAARTFAELPPDDVALANHNLLDTGRVVATAFERWLIGSVSRRDG